MVSSLRSIDDGVNLRGLYILLHMWYGHGGGGGGCIDALVGSRRPTALLAIETVFG